MGSPSRDGDVTVLVWHKPAELAHSFLSCSCVHFCLCGLSTVFHSINSPDSSRLFLLCSPGHISTLLVLSTIHLFMKVSFSPDIIFSGWLGLKHQLNKLCMTLRLPPYQIGLKMVERFRKYPDKIGLTDRVTDGQTYSNTPPPSWYGGGGGGVL